MGPGYFYTLGIESFLDAKPQFTHHCPLLHRLNIAQNLDIYSGVAQIINPQHLGRAFDYFTPFFILSERFAHSVYHAYGVVEVSVICYRDIEIDPGKVSGKVAGCPDLAIGYMVDYAIQVAEHSLSQSYFLHQPTNIGYPDYITHPVLVFQDDEDAGNEVSYQVLSAETEGYAGDAEASQNWRDG